MNDPSSLRTLDSSTRVVVLTDSGPIPSLYVRLLDPLPLITLNYNIVHSQTAGVETIAEAADVLVLQRWFQTPIRRLAEAAKRRGVPVIYETDDNLLDLPPQSQIKFTAEQQENMRTVIGLADMVLCSTELLADSLRTLNENVRVLPNYGLIRPGVPAGRRPHLAIVNTDYFKLDASKEEFFRALETAIDVYDYTITFFGSLDPLANDLMRSYPERVFHRLDTTDDRAAFIDLLAQSGINVAAVPLSETQHHAYKSDIKFLDFASISVPGIYNNRTVYPEVRSGVDGLVCEDTYAGWSEALRVFSEAERRAACGRAAKAVVTSGRSLERYSVQLGDVIARLVAGEATDSVALSRHPDSSLSDQLATGPTGLLWFQGNLYLAALGKRRHVRSVELIASILGAGFTFIDTDRYSPNEIPEGPPLTSLTQCLELRRRSRVPSSAPRADRLRISWIAPGLIIGGGGHRNIIRCAYHLERLGHEVSIYFTDTADSSDLISDQVREHFYPFEGHVGRFDEAEASGDILVATHWSTVAYAETAASAFGEIVYFVQDFEPSFYPTGSAYVMAEATYRRGYYAITSGEWCEKFLRESFGAEADHFRFPVDRSIYYERSRLIRENRLLFFAKPEMTRRCFELGVAALERLHKLRPDVEIGFYGSAHAADVRLSFPVTHYGLLPGPDDLAELYARSRLGLVFSTTNPSLVPYEMMACGLPVADLRRPGNEANYGGRYDIAYLADPDPSRMAAELAALLDDEADLARRSAEGLAFAAGFPVEEDVGRLIEGYMLRRVAAWSPERRRRAEAAA